MIYKIKADKANSSLEKDNKEKESFRLDLSKIIAGPGGFNKKIRAKLYQVKDTTFEKDDKVSMATRTFDTISGKSEIESEYSPVLNISKLEFNGHLQSGYQIEIQDDGIMKKKMQYPTRVIEEFSTLHTDYEHKVLQPRCAILVILILNTIMHSWQW